MESYLILPRFQFTSLYKFGEIYVDSENMVSADLPAPVLVNNLTEILKKLPYFEYDDEYIILCITTDQSESNRFNLSIEQVTEIIAFSQQAKTSIESKVYKKIKIEVTNWSIAILRNIEEYYQRKVMEKGIDALWRISGFDGEWRKEDFLPLNFAEDFCLGIKERGNCKSKDKQQKNILVQAIVYDRTEFFPDGYDGYLFDIFEILCNHLTANYQFKQTGLYPWLLEKHISDKSNCWTVYKNDTTNINLKNIKSKLVSKYPSPLRWENALSWFFHQKDNIQKIGQFNLQFFRTELERNKSEFINERKMAVILLGAFFGYKYFYDALYDEVNLKFFKEQKAKINTNAQLPQDLPSAETSIEEEGFEVKQNVPIIESIKDETIEQDPNLKDSSVPPIVEIQNSPNEDSNSLTEVPFEIDRSNEEIPFIQEELNKSFDLINSEILKTIYGLKLKDNITHWVISCFKKWKESGTSIESDLFEILLSDEKPKGFGDAKAKIIVETLLKDDLLRNQKNNTD